MWRYLDGWEPSECSLEATESKCVYVEGPFSEVLSVAASKVLIQVNKHLEDSPPAGSVFNK